MLHRLHTGLAGTSCTLPAEKINNSPVLSTRWQVSEIFPLRTIMPGRREPLISKASKVWSWRSSIGRSLPLSRNGRYPGTMYEKDSLPLAISATQSNQAWANPLGHGDPMVGALGIRSSIFPTRISLLPWNESPAPGKVPNSLIRRQW